MLGRVGLTAGLLVLPLSCGGSTKAGSIGGTTGQATGSTSSGDAGPARDSGRDANATGSVGGSVGTTGGTAASTTSGRGTTTTSGTSAGTASTGDAGSTATDARNDVATRDASLDAANDGSTCAVDCTSLSHVQTGKPVECRSGQCYIPAASCVTGYAHCSTNPNDGCEADLTQPTTCGSCTSRCTGLTPLCTNDGVRNSCTARPISCTAPRVACGGLCVDLQTDSYNCGQCGFTCNGDPCESGKCALHCFDPGYADCTSAPGCETRLGTTDNCASCGNKACSAAHTVLTCDEGTSCTSPICAAGYANCSSTSPDCEAAFGSAGATCFPRYVGTSSVGAMPSDGLTVAIGGDGSYVYAGDFAGVVDFDPTSGSDARRAAGYFDVFITKLNPDGTYAWTKTLGGPLASVGIKGLAIAADGSIVATGWYGAGAVDFDPGTGVASHTTLSLQQGEPYVLKLSATGAFVWARVLPAQDAYAGGTGMSVAVDGTGRVVIGGWLQGALAIGSLTSTANSTGDQHGFVAGLDTSGNVAWAFTPDPNGCYGVVPSVAIAADGKTWAAGNFNGACTFQSNAPAVDALGNYVAILTFGAGGTGTTAPASVGTVGAPSTSASQGDISAYGIAVAPDGNVYFGGTMSSGKVDLDPSAAEAIRTLPFNDGYYPGGFIASLSANGAFRWGQTMPNLWFAALTALPGGGVLFAGTAQELMPNDGNAGLVLGRIDAAGHAVSTLLVGGRGTNANAIASSSSGFAVIGTNNEGADFDPGPAIDVVQGGVTFLSRYGF